MSKKGETKVWLSECCDAKALEGTGRFRSGTFLQAGAKCSECEDNATFISYPSYYDPDDHDLDYFKFGPQIKE